MDLELRDKVVIVTGSTQGVGLGIAKSFLETGAFVIINGRDEKKVTEVSNILGASAIGIPGDVENSEFCNQMVQSAIEKTGKINVLVTNVGNGTSVPPLEETPTEWGKMISKNLYSATNMINAARKSLSQTKGSIVCISSICGLASLGAPATYSAAKAALNSYVRSVTKPLATDGIRINLVAPGNIIFEGSVWEEKLRDDETNVKKMLQESIPLARFGTPKEIGNFVCFLASSRASFATGSTFVVDGGQLTQ
jgi:3-oxoacyl-[acyl-carrier protein] reductase